MTKGLPYTSTMFGCLLHCDGSALVLFSGLYSLIINAVVWRI